MLGIREGMGQMGCLVPSPPCMTPRYVHDYCIVLYVHLLAWLFVPISDLAPDAVLVPPSFQLAPLSKVCK